MLSNNPVRSGDKYCAPFCGRGCTWQEFERATKAAADLAAKCGPGFEPEVWENLGWHACAVKKGKEYGCISVYHDVYQDNVLYYASVNDDRRPGGKWFAKSHSPKHAIKLVFRQMKEECDNTLMALKELE
jgi:hypothetical protein